MSELTNKSQSGCVNRRRCMPEEALEIEYRLACETRLRPQAPMRAKDGTASPPLPRITQLMALAIKLEGMRREGIIRDYSEVARLGHVSRARVSQIMSLLQLAPDLQEQLLFLPALQQGRVALFGSSVQNTCVNGRNREWSIPASQARFPPVIPCGLTSMTTSGFIDLA